MPPSPSPSKRGYETVLDLRSSSRRCPVNRSSKHHNIKIVLNLAGIRKADVAHPRVDRGDQLPLGLPQVMMALIRDGFTLISLKKLYRSIIITYLESRYGVLFKKERDNRAYMEGLSQGIHSKAHADGVGLKTIVRDINLHCLETWQG
uniref:Uncharacterized protein n=1 Tax=Lactuca sativa TaxID=4236 RepID=A0A9R1VGX0_LACSA|nr:hypothetical protein LSAT_V11C500255080 [Lactuca sativa]